MLSNVRNNQYLYWSTFKSFEFSYFILPYNIPRRQRSFFYDEQNPSHVTARETEAHRRERKLYWDNTETEPNSNMKVLMYFIGKF